MKDVYEVAAMPPQVMGAMGMWGLSRNGQVIAAFSNKANAEFARDAFDEGRAKWEAVVNTLPAGIRRSVLGGAEDLRDSKVAYCGTEWTTAASLGLDEAAMRADFYGPPPDEPFVIG